MPITNFDFPSVQLTQVFENTPTPNTSELGVVCVGPALESIVLEGRLDDNNCVEWKIAGLKATSIISATATTKTTDSLDGTVTENTDISEYAKLVIIDNDTGEITDATGTAKATHVQVVIPDTADFVLVDPATVKIECGATHVSRYGVVNALGDVEAELGPLSVENKLAVAVYAALSESGGNAVSYYIVDDTHDYTQALGVLDNKQNLYSVVITSSEIEDIKACITAIETTSKDVYSKVRHTLWYGIDVEDATTATEAVAELIAARTARTQSYRAQCVFGEGVIINGLSNVGSYALAAAAAGMRSYQPCHRPLSNLRYTAVSLNETLGFTRSDLKELGANGIWLICNKNGVPTNMRQVTTEASDNINYSEESIVANADEIAMTLANIGEDKVGCSNITNQLLLALADDITLIMDSKLLNVSGSAYIGPQLLSWTLDSLEQDATNLDHITATITCTPPKPFNTFKMTLVIV